MPHSLAALLVLLIPGWSLLAWLPEESPFRSAPRRDFLSSLADGAALSISLAALAALFLSWLGIVVSASAVPVLYALGLAALLGAVVRRGMRLAGVKPGWQLGYAVSGLALLAGVVAWRLYQAHTLALPAWVDSVHHALIVRLISEHGGLPPDFMPYFPVDFHYHYGFHLVTALFAFWARVPVSEALLWFGQVLNAVVSLSVYRLTYTMAADIDPGPDAAPRPGWLPFAMAFLAALLTGFAFQMPAYYLTWGRYTLLTGLVLLGPALAAAWEIRREPANRGAGVRLALLLAGISLTHYFVLILAGLFLLILGAPALLRSLRGGQERRVMLALVGWVGLGIALALPWLLAAGLAYPEQAGVSLVNPVGQSEAAWKSAVNYLRYVVNMLGPRHNHILLGLAGVGLLFSLRRRSFRPLSAWAFMLTLLSLPWGLRMNLFRPDYFAIILFFPASIVLAGFVMDGVVALGQLARPRPAWRAWVQGAGFALALGIFLAWGLRETRDVINSVTVLATRADVAALDWIRQNTPQDARFYNNSLPWLGSVYRGVDGGFWLEPYTGRFSLVPPALYGLASQDTVEQVKDWADRSGKLEGCGAEFWALVRDAGLTHLYLRQGSGALQPDDLVDCPRLRQLYNQDGIFIYEILRPQ